MQFHELQALHFPRLFKIDRKVAYIQVALGGQAIVNDIGEHRWPSNTVAS
tara:strand:+ start:952 stop:1101 length:150 start_codon:yes stop_codon:yes gene_type:complete